MLRVPPKEVDDVKYWCLANQRFDDANFIIDIKTMMQNSQKLSQEQAIKLTKILKAYKTEKDLEEMKKRFGF